MTSYQPPENPRRERSLPNISTAQLGMYVFLASLSVFFVAGILGLIITRVQSSHWRTEGMPALPSGLIGSTIILLVQGAVFRRAEVHLSANRERSFERLVGGALLLGLAFLLFQARNWQSMLLATTGVVVKSLYLYSFYLITALHAAHVLGGVVALAFVYHRATANHYSSSRSEGVRLVRQYWDFLAVAWLLLGAALYFCSVA